jgi:hypothetical protein
VCGARDAALFVQEISSIVSFAFFFFFGIFFLYLVV